MAIYLGTLHSFGYFENLPLTTNRYLNLWIS